MTIFLSNYKLKIKENNCDVFAEYRTKVESGYFYSATASKTSAAACAARGVER